MYQVTRIIKDLSFGNLEYIELVGHCEAEDIVGTIVKHYSEQAQYDEEDGEQIQPTPARELTLKEVHDAGYRVKMVA